MNSFGLYLLKSPTYIFVIANIWFDFFLNYCFLSPPHRLCHSLSQLKLFALPGVLAFYKKKGLNLQSKGSLIVPFLVLETRRIRSIRAY